MANYTTIEDLVDDVLFRAGENGNAASLAGSDYYNAIVKYLNRAYQSIWNGGGELLPDISEQWWWLQAYGSGVLTLLPVFDDNTVQVSNNSTTITFSSAPQRSSSNISVQGWHFKVDDHADVFRITSHTSGATSATLDSVYTGDNDTAASFRAFKIDYTLASDVAEINGPFRAYQSGFTGNRVEKIGPRELNDRWPMEQISSGVPQNYALIAQQSGLWTVRFSHYGGNSDTELIRLDYDYTAQPSDLTDAATAPAIPREYRKILADWALYFVYQDKEDSRADAALALAQSGLRAMAIENRRRNTRTSRAYGRIFPRASDRSKLKGPLRTESGLILSTD